MVFVYGDYIRDKWVYCETERVAEESPIPIYNKIKQNITYGGTNNIETTISKLALNNEENSCYECAGEAGCELNSLLYLYESYKYRFISHNNIVFRYDDDTYFKYDEKDYVMLNGTIDEIINSQEVNLVVLQDYNKGAITNDVVKIFQDRLSKTNIPIILNPKNITIKKMNMENIIIKMSRKEALSYFVKDNTVHTEDLCFFLSKEISAYAIVITDGANGAYVYFKEDNTFYHVMLNDIENGFIHIPQSHTLCAGDIMLGGMAYKLASYKFDEFYDLLNKENVLNSVVFGVKAGTASLKSIEPYYPTLSEVHAIQCSHYQVRDGLYKQSTG